MLGTLVGQLYVAVGVTVGRCRALNLDVHQLAPIGAQFPNQVIDVLRVHRVVRQYGLSHLKRQLQVAGSLPQLGLGLLIIRLVQLYFLVRKTYVEHFPRLAAVARSLFRVVVEIDIGEVFQP